MLLIKVTCQLVEYFRTLPSIAVNWNYAKILPHMGFGTIVSLFLCVILRVVSIIYSRYTMLYFSLSLSLRVFVPTLVY